MFLASSARLLFRDDPRIIERAGTGLRARLQRELTDPTAELPLSGGGGLPVPSERMLAESRQSPRHDHRRVLGGPEHGRRGSSDWRSHATRAIAARAGRGFEPRRPSHLLKAQWLRGLCCSGSRRPQSRGASADGAGASPHHPGRRARGTVQEPPGVDGLGAPRGGRRWSPTGPGPAPRARSWGEAVSLRRLVQIETLPGQGRLGPRFEVRGRHCVPVRRSLGLGRRRCAALSQQVIGSPWSAPRRTAAIADPQLSWLTASCPRASASCRAFAAPLAVCGRAIVPASPITRMRPRP